MAAKEEEQIQASVTPAKKDKLEVPEPPPQKTKPTLKKGKSRKKWIYISLGAVAVGTGFAGLVLGQIIGGKDKDPGVEDEGPLGGDAPPDFPD